MIVHQQNRLFIILCEFATFLLLLFKLWTNKIYINVKKNYLYPFYTLRTFARILHLIRPHHFQKYFLYVQEHCIRTLKQVQVSLTWHTCI